MCNSPAEDVRENNGSACLVRVTGAADACGRSQRSVMEHLLHQVRGFHYLLFKPMMAEMSRDHLMPLKSIKDHQWQMLTIAVLMIRDMDGRTPTNQQLIVLLQVTTQGARAKQVQILPAILLLRFRNLAWIQRLAHGFQCVRA